jgi:mono/diheme cytochrome c family protein
MKAAVAVLMMAGLYAAVAAQSAAKTTWDGVYSEAQAKRGEAEYTKTCAGCHGPELAGADAAPSLTGPEFNASWNDLTADELAERVKVTMPADAPNTLSHCRASRRSTSSRSFSRRTAFQPDRASCRPRRTG